MNPRSRRPRPTNHSGIPRGKPRAQGGNVRHTGAYKIATGLAAAMLLLGACSSGGTAGGGSSVATQILRIGSNDEIDSLNPFVGLNSLSYSTF